MMESALLSLTHPLHIFLCLRRGLGVILGVVFNHTAKRNENGPTLSFRCGKKYWGRGNPVPPEVL